MESLNQTSEAQTKIFEQDEQVLNFFKKKSHVRLPEKIPLELLLFWG